MKVVDDINRYLRRYQLALQADCDMILMGNNRSAVLSIIEWLEDCHRQRF